MKLTRYEKNPIIAPDPRHDWECRVTTNPGAWYDEQRHEVTLLYRAAGDDPQHVIHLARAVSNDGYSFKRFDKPVFSPSKDGFDAGCVEDPRIVKFGEYYFITYATRFFPPGEYWRNDKARFKAPECPADFPRAVRNNRTNTGLLLTRDFNSYIRAGRLTDPTMDDRDVILFPEKVGGKYVMLHRPADWVGEQYGTEFPAIWIAQGDDLLKLNASQLLAKAEYDWECKIGGNTPPIKTKHGWLTLYHAVGDDKRYRLGAMLLSLENPAKVICRTRDWIIQPEAEYELNGPYEGCIFPCGKIVIDGTLFVYYGAADRYVALATCPLQELLDYLLSCPV